MDLKKTIYFLFNYKSKNYIFWRKFNDYLFFFSLFIGTLEVVLSSDLKIKSRWKTKFSW